MCKDIKTCLVMKYLVINLLLYLSNGYTIEKKAFNRSNFQSDFSKWLFNYTGQSESLCCASGVWEADAFLTYGAVLSIPEATSFFFYNGTGRIAFDNGETYQIDEDGNCMKQTISRNMKIVCIPETSKRLVIGEIETETVSTYQFSTSDRAREHVITASVLQNGTHCDPVTISRAEYLKRDATHGTVYSLDVMDLAHGIKDPTIFVRPKSCKNN